MTNAEEKRIVIIIPTSTNYLGIVKNFLELLHKYWNNCPYRVIVSTTGNNETIKGYKTIRNGKNASLTKCVKNALEESGADYAICFLGDAFITKKIDDKLLKDIIGSVINNNIDYCCLNFVKNYRRKKEYSEYLRYINSKDRYSHSFVSFIASKDYIKKTLDKFETDLEFEMYYLHENKEFYYEKDLIVNKNYLNILPSIASGKWDKINYLKLKRNNPEIHFEEREQTSLAESIIRHLRGRIINRIPQKLRIMTKKALNINFGVQE